MAEVLEKNNLHGGICTLIIGEADLGKLMAADKRIPLVSATGSTRMGKSVGQVVGERLGKSLLELVVTMLLFLLQMQTLKWLFLH